MADTKRRVTIEHIGSEPDWRIALGIIMRQLMRGATEGDGGNWSYKVEVEGEPRA